ncbi:MAG: DUF1800 domain-containing protein [Blastocatellia bacterium]|nr:DUF1800 domain-containing protein [Blastocatellia bacterium]
MTIPTPVEIAHLLKRTGFAARPADVEKLSQADWETALSRRVDEAQPPQIASNLPFRNYYLDPEEEEDYDRDFLLLLNYELNRLTGSEIGLGDRMLWFWHGLITSGYSEVDVASLLFRQHQLLAKHALGNFRQMLIDITTDAAMLTYLGGDGSTGDSPNENYARELLELFTLGRGHYQQADVRAAALVFSGWYLKRYPTKPGLFDPGLIEARFDPESGYDQPVTFLGVTAKFDIPSVIDRILAQDACATYIARRLFQYFVHPEPDEASIAGLANVFRSANYEIKPLLAALFRHPVFRDAEARGARLRLPFETVVATAAAFGITTRELDAASFLMSAGQLPFDPPNVAGWPLDRRWVSAPQTIARIQLGLQAFDLSARNPAVLKVATAEDPVSAVLAQTGLYETSTSTRNELTRAAATIPDRSKLAQTLLALAVASPEFAFC